VPEFLAALSAGQRQVLAALAALVVLLGLAAGAVALGDDDPGALAVQTEGDGTTSTSSGAASSSSSPSSSTSSTPDGADDDGADDEEDDDRDDEAEQDRGDGSARSSTTLRRGSATTARSTPTTRGGSGPAPSSTAPPTTQPAGTGCTTGGSGGTARELADRYCRHRGTRATARMERNDQLDAAAASWAAELGRRGELAHGDYNSAVRAVCPTCTGGENVAVQHPPDLEAAWDRWLGSPPHRANLDNPKGGVYGTGVAQVGDRMYYVHIFGWR
jgi:uncharacterized protein YkwD